MAHPPAFDDTELDARIAEGWRLRVIDVPAMRPFAARLRADGADRPSALAWADLFDAWGLLGVGQREDSGERLAAATGAMARLGDATGTFACRQLQAYLLVRDGHHEAGRAASAALVAEPEDGVPLALRFTVLSMHAAVSDTCARTDDALHFNYAALATARRLGDAAFVAHAAAATGGMQCSLLNLEDALPLCEESWSLCDRAGWNTVTALVGPNRMMVLSALARHAEACALAEELLSREAGFAARHRVQRLTLYGTAFAEAGDLGRAQAMLDSARRERPADGAARAEWVWTQARVWNRTGRAAEALALLQPYLDADPDITTKRTDRDYPIDRANLATEAAAAHEALGDLAAALRWTRAAARAREDAMRLAAHARRLTLQIDHELDSARRQRDGALREQERLAELNRALRAADEAKTRFLAAASHDLRQPVHALGLQLATLRERAGGDAAEIGRRMEASVQSLGALFDALLDLSQIDAGLIRADVRDVDLRPLLVRLTDEVAEGAATQGLRLLLRLPREAHARTDALLLERVLRNLIDNALKYTAHGGVLLALRPHGDSAWSLQVWDTGIGIAPAHQARVFDEFHQVANPGRDRRQGLGLGLAIVRRLCVLLGHPLALHSRPGRGSRFTLSVPRAAGVAAAVPAALPQADPAPLCVAVIEDDPLVSGAVQALLEQWGHRVLVGEAAADIVVQCGMGGRPDAVIADLRLAGERQGDAEAAALAQAVGRPLPTLIVTGDTAPDPLRALAASGLAWLPKPVAPLRLRSWLAGILPAAR